MQNKAKYQKSQMNVNKLLTKDYEKTTLGERGKNKPKTNPKQSQTNPKQIEDPEGTQFQPEGPTNSPLTAAHRQG